MSFHALGLSDELLAAVNDSGYTEPTPIQRQTIPLVLMGRDVIGIAQTGTGKTASFVLPMIDILAQGRARARMPRSLIIAPTRELADQVAENFKKYGKNHNLTMALLIGGVSFGDQDKALERGVDVLIATPGRLLDQFERGKILMSGVSILVIDEADRMLDMGFIPDVERICSLLGPNRQSLLFSATMAPPIKKLADRFLTDPRMVEVARQATANANIAQSLVQVDARGKRDALIGLLRESDVTSAIIFCNRKKDVKLLCETLQRQGLRAGQIHGDMEQRDRLATLDAFKRDEISILVGSDVAARGLDIKGVSHVFNYDVPFNAEDYVHRIGRTGRAGKTGIAITLATPAEGELIADIERLIGTKIERRAGSPAAKAAKSAPQSTEKPARKPRAGKAAATADAEPAAPTPAPTPERRSRRTEPAERREPPAQTPTPARAAKAPSRPPRDPVSNDGAEDSSDDWCGPVPSFLSVSAR